MDFANCKRCNKIYRKLHSPYCGTCYKMHMANFSHVYRYLQDHPTMTLTDIAEECHVPVKELEELLFTGQLGTASEKIIYHCQRCATPMAPLQRRGRFCLPCTRKVEEEGKIDPREKEKRERRELEVMARKQRKERLSGLPEPPGPDDAFHHEAGGDPERHLPVQVEACGEPPSPPEPVEEDGSFGFKRNRLSD